MILLIILLPAIGFFNGILMGRYLGRFCSFITTVGLILSFLISAFLLVNILLTGSCYKIDLGYWLSTNFIKVNWCLYFDGLTSIMLFVVTGVSSLVHLFSIEYMNHDPHIIRFMSYLSLFSFFMLVLITSGNFLQMFIGWEGVGLCSYLLINFWFTRIQANKSAIKAMLVNRVGDFFILIAFFSISMLTNTLDYSIFFNMIPFVLDTKIILGFMEISSMDFICTLLLLGAMGKSAQVGLHTWLPDAMEGPTPVSALIHAATMVTAGVFLIVKCSFLFEYSSIALDLTLLVGSLTAFFAATTGLFQNDIKRIIAYSTCSQLGYMILICGLSGYEVSIFHLFNHAFFKALLFLAAGSIIHSMCDEQDIRNMGGLISIIPFSYSSVLIGSLALVGFPFLSGFFSKDVILEIAFSKHSIYGNFAFTLGVVSAFCTCFYSAHLLILTFLSKPNGNGIVINSALESNWKIKIPLIVLVLFSITVGYFTKEIFLGFGTNFWGGSIFFIIKTYTILDIEFGSTFFKILPLVITSFGFVASVFIYHKNLSNFFQFKINKTFRLIYVFLIKKWYFDRIYNQFINQRYIKLSYLISYKDIDRGLIEKMGPLGVITTFSNVFLHLKYLQTGYMFHYLLMVFFFICLLFTLISSYLLTTISVGTLLFLACYSFLET